MKARKQKCAFGALISGLLLLLLATPIGAAGEQKPDLALGARLWRQNCGTCHNVRRPPERSDRQWELIVAHMRLRANITGADARAILEFIKASN